GYAPDFDLSEKWSGYDEAMKRLAAEPLRNPPDTRFVYSDINYIALGEIVRRVSGMTLDEFARKNIFEPLGMRSTGFRPRAALAPLIAPTETRRAAGSYLGGTGDKTTDGERWLRGEIDVESLISHRLTLDEVNRGFELMEAQDGIRSVIGFG
ncbi:MAG: serine hydrolase, partial [Pyrinomonadaceae bacterium]